MWMTCRHTTRFVIAYVAFLPLGLWRHCSYWTLAVAPLITFMLAGIENIGVQVRQCAQNIISKLLRCQEGSICDVRAVLHVRLLAMLLLHDRVPVSNSV